LHPSLSLPVLACARRVHQLSCGTATTAAEGPRPLAGPIGVRRRSTTRKTRNSLARATRPQKAANPFTSLVSEARLLLPLLLPSVESSSLICT